MLSRPGAFALAASMMVSLPVLAQSTVTTPPAPATVPATTITADRAKVLVLPLTEISEGTKREWIGRAMHQSMLAELARLHFVEPLTSNTKAAADSVSTAEVAAQTGADAGAAFVVFGSYQIVGDDLRVTGQIIDVATAKVAGGLKATGNVRDLFGVEDILAAQLKRELASAIEPTEARLDVVANAPTTQPAPGLAPIGAAVPAGPAPQVTYEGSELQKALRAGASNEQTLDDSYNKYRHGDPSPSYYPDYGYRTPYGYNYYPYYPRTIVVVPQGTDGTGAGTPTVNGKPAELPDNGNYSKSPSGGKDNRPIGGNFNESPNPNANQGQIHVNTAPSGGVPRRSIGGNANTAPSGGVSGSSIGGNTVTGTSGNTVTGTSGNTNSAGPGSNSQ